MTSSPDPADTIRRVIEYALTTSRYTNLQRDATEALATLDALLSELRQAQEERDAALRKLGRHDIKLRQAIDALWRIEPMQQQVLAGLKKHGIVFDRAPSVNPDPSDWQQVAFSIYTSLCEVDSIVSAALVNLGEQP